MTSELAERQLAEHQLDAAQSPLAIISTAIQKGVGADELGKLMDLQERFERNQAADAYAVAIAGFQAKCPMIHKGRMIDLGGGKGPSYASFDDIMRQIKPLLGECGLSLSFTTNLTDGGMMHCVCSVRHGRHVEQSEVTLPVPSNMRVNDTQKMGAALQYGKRYALCAALNIVVTDEDSDGAGLIEAIGDKDIAVLNEWLEATGIPLSRLLKWAGVDSLTHFPVGKFPAAIVMFQDYQRKHGGK